jgi:hypothetical protein
MRHRARTACIAITAATSAAVLSQAAHASIIGFNNLNGWTYNQSDGGTPVDLPNPDAIHLTNPGNNQARSVFYNTRQNITQFTASFTYRSIQAGPNAPHGATFTLTNDAAGPNALGDSGGGLGFTGIQNSVAISLNVGHNTVGFHRGGVIGSVNPTGLDLGSDHEFAVALSYGGNFLNLSLTDLVTGVEFAQNIFVGDILPDLGDTHAYVGLTASTGPTTSSDQYFSDFRFASVPAPSGVSLMATALLATSRRRR